ncbi:hypothetical protein C8K36_1215 [Rhodococcus sp. OK519]|nr:hypothetical protein C8K36_1215 [Rhodococcus sp. OK519]
MRQQGGVPAERERPGAENDTGQGVRDGPRRQSGVVSDHMWAVGTDEYFAYIEVGMSAASGFVNRQRHSCRNAPQRQ